ncbi:MAG TPA: methylated-DNA--[protein]-cysteine S-methyltransferase [Solirubrobacteraceae bacterium]|nr:methylated-DNA--[protein]-cysteine S-methyltransferase [Solirubrobacteraceae bacterium]
MRWDIYESPFGPLTLIGSETGLREVHFPGRAAALDRADRDRDLLRDVRDQLGEYFTGERETFEVALDLSGTAFKRRVWRALQGLPYGRVTTYAELARELGVRDSGALVTGERTVTAAQKVGWAVGATPTPIVIPCHRVIGADGSLTGYRGGLQRKRALLDFEAAGGRAGFWTHQGQLALL